MIGMQKLLMLRQHSYMEFTVLYCTLVGLNFKNLKSEPAACQHVSYLFRPNQKALFFSKLRHPKSFQN